MTTLHRDVLLSPLGNRLRLLVVGSVVTEEQANEVLVRTDSWSLLTNDIKWKRDVHALAVIEHDQDYTALPSSLSTFLSEYEVLNLKHFNNCMIAAGRSVGLHGWCSWDGTIGCSSYDIETSPTHQDVIIEWTNIASSFPFLNLTVQLVAYNNNVCTELDHPIVTIFVANGLIYVVNASKLITTPCSTPQLNTDVFLSASGVFLTRGVSLRRLHTALKQIRERLPYRLSE